MGFSLDKNKVTSLLLQPGFKICYARLGEQVLCARIIYICKKQAADVFAANSFNSMRYSATHFIMESIFNWLKKRALNNSISLVFRPAQMKPILFINLRMLPEVVRLNT